MIKKILAKNTDHEFALELPFKSKRELSIAIREYKVKYYPELVGKNVACYEFFLQYMDDPNIEVEDIKPSTAVTKSSMIRKYGVSEGLRRWEEKRKHDSIKGTLEYYVEKYGSDVGKKKYDVKNSRLSVSESALRMNGKTDDEISEIRLNHRNKSGNTLENFIQRYGIDKGTGKFDDYVITMKKVDLCKFPSQHQYWINSGCDEVEASRRVKEFQSKGLKTFMRLYGEYAGTIKYKEYVKSKTSSRIAVGSASKESMKIFKPLREWLISECGFEDRDVKVGIDGSEEYMLSHDNGIYMYDFTIIPLNIIIEYNGEAFHPNPKWKYEDPIRWDVWKCLYSNLNSDMKRKFDEAKNALAESCGMDVVEVWSSDDHIENLEKLKNIIRSKL